MNLVNAESEEILKHDILIELGFKKLNNGEYEHFLLNGVQFDFSAASIRGVFYLVYNQGKLRGKAELKSEIKNLLGA